MQLDALSGLRSAESMSAQDYAYSGQCATVAQASLASTPEDFQHSPRGEAYSPRGAPPTADVSTDHVACRS